MSSRPCKAAALVAVVLAVTIACPLWGVADPVPPPTPPTEKELGAWWADLEKGEADATRAILKLSQWPKESVAFLRGRLKPIKIEVDEVKALLAKLGSADEAEWKPAFEELEYLDPRLAIDLETLMNDVKEAPARQRMVAVLCGRAVEQLAGKDVQLRSHMNGEEKYYNFFDGRGSWWAEHRVARINTIGWSCPKPKWTRATRAIGLLEHVGSSDAVAVLKYMAVGHPEAHPTKEAREVVLRLGKPGK
jgi:hypothetical protein